MAAMNDHHSPPAATAAEESTDDTAAARMAYLRDLEQLAIQFNSPETNPDNLLHLLHLLRQQRPAGEGVTLPASVTAALDDLEDLLSSSSYRSASMMEAFLLHKVRWSRASHVAALRRATSQRLSIDGEVFLLAADITALRNSVEEKKGVVQRVQRRMVAAVADGSGVGGERAAAAASLAERLGRAQAKEEEMTAEMEGMERDYRRLLRKQEDAVAAELTERAALEEIPRLHAATQEEFQLVLETERRFRENVIVLSKYM